MVKGMNKRKFELKFSFADSDLRLLAYIKTVQDKLLLDIAYKHYIKSVESDSLGRCR